MPIKNVPIVHKFGIISHSQRLELQSRLARKVLEEEGSNKFEGHERSNQYRIDEAFVKEFNNVEAESFERHQYEKRAQQIFLRAKRKAGLRNGGIGTHVNLQSAWKDLSLLAMCESRRFQEGALNALYESLYYSPISQSHVPSLLQLAENSIRWLTGTGMNAPYLRTGELELLKVTHLVFIRLYYHHLAADIVGFHTNRTQLVDMLQAFQENQDIYRPFPGSLLLVRLIIKIGAALRTGLENELKTLIETNRRQSLNQFQHHNIYAGRISQHSSENKTQMSDLSPMASRLSHQTEVGFASVHEQLKSELMEENAEDGEIEAKDSYVPSVESVFHEVGTDRSEAKIVKTMPNIHDTSPTLWHCLELWRIVTHSNERITDAISELLTCSLDFHNEPMLDCIIALHVLTEVAKLEPSVHQAFQFIAKRDILTQTQNMKASTNENQSFMDDTTLNDWSMNTGSQERNKSLGYVPSILDTLRGFLDPRPIGECEDDDAQREEFVELSYTEKKEVNLQDAEVEKFQESSDTVSRKLVKEDDDGSGCVDTSKIDEAANAYSRVGSSEPPNDSASEGSLADVSSLASSQSRFELKTRSSKRRTRRRATTHDHNDVTDDSDYDDDGRSVMLKGSTRMKPQEYVTRESTMTIGFQEEIAQRPSTSCTITRPNTSIEAMTRWPWELVVAYVNCLGEICRNGRKSQTQKDALVGCVDENAGLLQMLKYQLSRAPDNSDWSWRVRHVAVQELIKISHNNNNNSPSKDGIQNAAWSALLSHHTVEKDRRVLEAYKIARTEVNLEDKEDNSVNGSDHRKNSLFSRICTNLSIIYTTPQEDNPVGAEVKRSPRGQKTLKDETALNGLGSSIHQMSFGQDLAVGRGISKGQGLSKGEGSLKGQRLIKGEVSPRRKGKTQKMGRVSLRDEILIATALDPKPDPYVKRSWFDVKGVVEDQWRKELSEEHDITERRKQSNMDREIDELRNSMNTKLLSNH